MTKTVGFALRDNVAWITLNRPEAFNAIGLDAMQELHDIAGRCGSDRAVRAAVITGPARRRSAPVATWRASPRIPPASTCSSRR